MSFELELIKINEDIATIQLATKEIMDFDKGVEHENLRNMG